MKDQIKWCPKCHRILQYGKWKNLEVEDLEALEKNPEQWKLLADTCPDCEDTILATQGAR